VSAVRAAGESTSADRTGRDVALSLDRITAGYGAAVVLRDVDLTVPTGTVAALLGPNGAGKTTLLRAAAGLLRIQAGAVRSHGADLTGRPADDVARHGVCLIPEGRGVFPSLTVRQNLRLFAPERRSAEALERTADFFPALVRHLDQAAGSLSGGEQQMLALSRAIVSDARVILVDEASMGLAPIMVDQVFAFLARIAAEGASLLVVEQYVHRALEIASHVYLLNRGRIVFAGPPADLAADDLFRRYVTGQ
jgi:branched-chain amino acid transport system ATP-binding protein